MIIGEVDRDVIQKILDSLQSGMRRVEAGTSDGRKITGYYVTDRQIRIDIVEVK